MKEERKGGIVMKGKKTLCISLLGLLIAWGGNSTLSWGAEAYKIGGVFSITGSSSFLGDPEKKSLEMAIEQINAGGGVDGHLLEAVVYDDEGEPTKAVLQANKLISSDKVIAIIGPSLTPTTLAIVPVVEENKMLLISCAAGIKITDPVKPLVFKTAQSDSLAVAAIYDHIRKQGLKKIGIITVATAFGESGKEQLTAQAPKYGLEIVESETFGASDTDMTAQLTKLRIAQPQAIVCWGTNPGPAVVAKNAQQLNISTPLYQSHGVASPKFIELAGDAAEGNLLPAGKILVADLLPESDPQKAVLLGYKERFTNSFHTPVSGFGGYAHDAMELLAGALKGSDGDMEKVRTALESLTGYTGVTGVFNYTPTDHNGLGADAFVMVRIKNGKWELVSE
jgi:branched-chain amino acid transport system substrate-binding protein